ncbi:MAG: CDP-alcohol phosphatidyltransferase family protein [Francisellaceae bacterium]
MLEKLARHYYQIALVDPLVKLIGHSVSSISVTLLAGLFGVFFIPFLLTGHIIWAVACLLFSGYLDTLDGSLARYQNNSTPLGSVLDIMTDRVVEFCVIFAFYLVDPVQHGLAVILMLGSILLCITSFLVVGVFTPNDSDKSFHYSPGLIERAEAFAFFIAMTLVPTYFELLAFIFSGLVMLTAIIRLLQFAKLQQKRRLGHFGA